LPAAFLRIFEVGHRDRLSRVAAFENKKFRPVVARQIDSSRPVDPTVQQPYGKVTTATEYPPNFSVSLLKFIVAGGWKLVV
jgi:hypothetical protein